MAEDERRLPDLSDAHLREIGRVTIMFNRLQAVLRLIIDQLLGGDTITKDVAVRGDSFHQLLAKLESLVNARIPHGPLRTEVTEWRQAALRANELRRETIHSQWMALSEGDESEALALLHSKTGRAIRGGLLSSEQIAILAKAIQATGIWGLDILNRLPEIELRSYPEKTAPPD